MKNASKRYSLKYHKNPKIQATFKQKLNQNVKQGRTFSTQKAKDATNLASLIATHTSNSNQAKPEQICTNQKIARNVKL